ncbi:glycoside hydrolase family 10 protein [Wolfiporia cocos MD-104 SS10]|uniref:Beta-xylanase n=1 Tax=Wolfiporia cocos (strain MD-104) TaxID=742152 RepID=A0A2H3JNM8_WOLCO|nr:glycoside hydrolase family 10 protein [Wolfiporia cocos MD-104 SS10]
MAIAALTTLVALAHIAVAIPQTATAASSALPTATAVVPGLNFVAKSAGKLYFGTATDNPELNDTAYDHILDNFLQFGAITPANSMKWDATEPEPYVFTFEAGDVIADLAHENGMLLRGHNCVWYNQLPSWVTANNYTAPELAAIIQNRCATLVGHYRGQVYAWDIINEPFNDNGTYREDVFYNTLGTSYIPIALTAARAADPNAKLYINEYNNEYLGPKSTALLDLVKELKAEGVPIDGVGFQCHFVVGEVPTTMVENFQQYAAIGLEFAITELDIRMPLPATPEMLEQQKTDYDTVVSACMAVPNCVGISVWDWTDKYSWIPSTYPGYGEACPWDANFVRKPAYDGIVIALENRTSVL